MIHNFIGKQESDRNGSRRSIISNLDTVRRIFDTAEIISFIEQRIKPTVSIFNLGRRNKVTAKVVKGGGTTSEKAPSRRM